MPYTAIQAIFDDEQDVLIGNAIATFTTLAGGAIGISIGESILVSKLLSEVPKYTKSIPPQAVISSGALNLDTLTNSPVVIDGLRQAYGKAISAVMICATVAIGVSSLTTLGMRPLNLKVISREREAARATTPVKCSSSITVEPKPHEVSERAIPQCERKRSETS
ncbi:MAG: hypothetical protein HETSPECPRED_000624 [Heterodermia speciosa]|uniref:Uncharacterized protein n=1 Tax=Heterodermia speciosa TaxID=116794 RepID=A0A8H3G720_9LECA|nr:MAG: hypothetical protein HETSPECPRED_000624 [Heterodermia speciosa]